jgi:hypothetical protein
MAYYDYEKKVGLIQILVGSGVPAADNYLPTFSIFGLSDF